MRNVNLNRFSAHLYREIMPLGWKGGKAITLEKGEMNSVPRTGKLISGVY
jgi:hypothetical protein